MLLKEYTWQDWLEARNEVADGGKKLTAIQDQFSALTDAITKGISMQKESPQDKKKA